MLSGFLVRVRALWRGVRRRSDVESEMTDEFRLHLELRARDLMRSGLPPDEAARRARLEFGSTEHYKDKGRQSRGLRLVDTFRFSWLDFKLGGRMLLRYPGLTLVGGFAIAFAIWVGAGTFEFLTQVVHPRLPFDEGDRIVALRNWDAAANRPEARALQDFVRWRDELESIDDLGAARTIKRNLIIGEGQGEPVDVAEISASAFRLTRVPPLLGRPLLDTDEQWGASPVVVIGYDLWQRRFAGAPNVVGRTIRLGNTASTVIGIMTEGFAFPVAHEIWAPLRLNVLDYERRQGPAIQIFGRLAAGASFDEAQTELTTLGRRAAADFPNTHQHLRPQVMPYAKSLMNLPGWASLGLVSTNLVGVMLLALICANVALLMFARAAARESEIVVRTALGASRSRIVTQLFAEALVLAGVAAIVGLAAAGFGLKWLLGVVQAQFLDDGVRLPFWFNDRLSSVTVLYAGGLTLLGAVVAGVAPALKVTRGIATRLKQAAAGAGGLRFGGLWTAVIVTQVAVTVAFPAVAFFVRQDAEQVVMVDPGFPAQEYLSMRLEMDRDAPRPPNDTSQAAFLARFAATVQELERRLTADPTVTGVTFAGVLPRMYHEWNEIEVDEGAVTPRDARGHRVSAADIDLDYFDVLGTPILSGRAFHSGDLAPDARFVIVNKTFVDQVVGGRNPIGRRVRLIASESLSRGRWKRGRSSEARSRSEGPWYEIVGVARDLGMTSGYGRAGIYHPMARGSEYPVHMAVHVRGNPQSFVPKLRAAATAADPTLRLHGLMPLDAVIQGDVKFSAFWFRLTLMVSSIALLLSLAGIYAVMSFTVSRRTREIGVRVALGADPRRIALAIFGRPLAQVAFGVIAGGGLVAVLLVGMNGGALSARQTGMVVAYATLMMGICMLACIVPTRRALRVQPTEALRADG